MICNTIFLIFEMCFKNTKTDNTKKRIAFFCVVKIKQLKINKLNVFQLLGVAYI